MSLLTQFNYLKTNNTENVHRSAFIEILETFVYAEKAMSLNHPLPWSDGDIAKRRKTYEYDEQLQEILLYRSTNGFIDGFSATKIKCGGTNYYKCELINEQGNVIHAGVSFTNSKYQEFYIRKNIDHEKPMYVFLQYQLNAEKTKVVKLSIRIPLQSLNDEFIDITRELDFVRDKMNKNTLTEQQLIESITSCQEK